jgi:prepilin-type N-terminal cleavage/methylation domain-containing protein
MKEEGRGKKIQKQAVFFCRHSSFVHRPSGFTLVELLAATGVIAIGLVFVLGALGRCMTSLTVAQRMIEANYLLSDKMWESDLGRRAENGAQEGSWEGVFEAPNDRFNWTRLVAGVTADMGNRSSVFNQTYAEETVRVLWMQGKTQRSVDVTRYVKRKQI